MNCTDFELAAQERLDLRQPELPEEFRAHASSCGDCRSFWQGQLRLLAVTSDWENVEIPAGLPDAVMRELSADVRPAVVVLTPRRPESRVSGWTAACSTAALVLLVASLIRIGPTVEPRRQSVAAIDEVQLPPSEATAFSPTPMIADLLIDLRSEYLELSQSTTRVLDEWAELPRAADLVPNLSHPAASPLESTPAWPRIDRPVSDRMGQAFDFLWDVVPHDASRSS